MIKLLRTNFYMIFRSLSFWVLLLSMPLVDLFILLLADEQLKDKIEWNIVSFGDSCFLHLLLMGYASAILVGMQFGGELTFGTVRNKLTAGYSRMQIYFGSLIAGVCECVIVHLFSTAVLFTICCIRYGFDGDLRTVGMLTANSLPPAAAFAAAALFFVTAAGDRTAGILTAFGADLIFKMTADMFLLDRLVSQRDKLSDTAKRLIIAADSLIPSGYCEWFYSFGEMSRDTGLEKMPSCGWCCVTLILFSAAGAAVFCRKDLK